MFDIGLGEILVIAVIALVIFGPDRLPKAAADAARLLKQVRGMAANARRDLADSAGLDLTDTIDTVKSLGDLHPRRIARQLLDDEQSPPPSGKRPDAPLFDPDAT